MNDDTIICSCLGVTVEDVKNAVKNGAKSFEEVQEITGLGTACGDCIDTSKDFINTLLVND
ncbi:MAG: bacterioferritin-associated ferredoxin [Oscillospiraceae bacterium]